MIIKTTNTTLKCYCCGMEFSGKYYDFGSIHHNNYTCDGNLQVSVNRFYKGDAEAKYDVFLTGIALDWNMCNLEDVQLKNSMNIFECRQKWFKKHGHGEIFNYMEDHRQYIKEEFDKVVDYFIEEKENELKAIKMKKTLIEEAKQ